MKNIVLIGLSGCGKSTVGIQVAHMLQMEFVDMDDYIESKENKTVGDIFAEKGEAYFRKLETDVACELSQTGNKIIATGGGVVLNHKNMEYLQTNGIILFLDRTPEAILKKINLKKRPLLAQNPNRLYAMDKERRPLYERYAQLTVKGAPTVEQTVAKIITAIKPFME